MIRRLLIVLLIGAVVAVGDPGIRASLGLGSSLTPPRGTPRLRIGEVRGSPAPEGTEKPDDPGDPREVCSFAQIEASYKLAWGEGHFNLSHLTIDQLPRCKATAANIALYDNDGNDLWSTGFALRRSVEVFPVEPQPLVEDVNGLRISVVDEGGEVGVPGLCAARLFPRQQFVAPSDFDNIFTGSPQDDKLLGTWRRDLMIGYEGNDRISGFTVPGTMDDFGDTLDRAVQEQSIKGLLGGDCIDGGGGDDFIYGHIGNDVILGGAGDDEILGGLGHDVIDGGPGFDTCVGGTLDGEGELTEAVWRDEFLNCEVIR